MMIVPFSSIMKFILYFDDKEVLEVEEDSVFLPEKYQGFSPANWLALPASQEVNVRAIYDGISYNATILQVRHVKLQMFKNVRDLKLRVFVGS